tara:strand:+ start:3207 stop:5228 length:2022 start_codon:yes stop_codon:yes gene_type:complete
MSFIEELKRRKVFRVAASYAVVAFVIMQLVEILFPMFNFPQWTQQFTVIIVLLGFPIAVILSWIFDKTPGGYVKTDEPESQDMEGMNIKVDNRPFYLEKRNLFLVFGIVAGILIGTYGGSSITNKVDSKSIAVLPFDNYSTAEEDQYFSDGVTEVITANLAKIGGLKVISRTSVMEYKNTTKKIKEIAEELGVAHILEGSIQRIGENIRIVGQLINTKTDEHIWAETYDGKIDDIFMMQSDVALKIGEALKAKISDESTALITKKPTENIQAYELYLKAFELIRFSEQEDLVKKAIQYLKLATSLDQKFVDAYALLADGHLIVYWFNFDRSPERLNLAKDAIDHAKKLNPNHPSVLKADGSYYYYGFRNYAKALIQYEKARDISPGDTDVWNRIGWINRRIGEWDEAIIHLEKSRELNPRSGDSYFQLGVMYGLVGDYENGANFFRKTIELDPTHIDAYLGLSDFLMYDLDDVKSAVEILEETLTWTESPGRKILLIDYYIQNSEYDKALSFAESFDKEIIPHLAFIKVKSTLIGLVHRFSGNMDEAEDHFRKSISILENELEINPDNYAILLSLGENYAYLENEEEAINFGKRSVEILPESKDTFFGPNVLSRFGLIYTILGMEDEAIDIYDHVTSVPAGFTTGYLKKHPYFNKLRNNPRFKKILEKGKPLL